MSTYLSRRTETFVVRLWAEYLEQSPPTWRGEIEHVGSKEVLRFRDLSELGDHIQRWVSVQRHANGQEEGS